MVKLRTGDPWMSAPEYGRTLKNLSLNLLVKSIERALGFQTKVLEAKIVYSDPDIAVLRGHGAEWMLHADHTYMENPMYDLISSEASRGVGVEIRLHGLDPDSAEANAIQHGYTVFAPAKDKAHGMRETYLIDPDGYMWVPDIPIDAA